jgi:DNA-binding CsgD family transcriptional regulator
MILSQLVETPGKVCFNVGITPFSSILNSMQTLTSTDSQRLNQAIQQLYALQNSQTFGRDALTIVNQLVPSEIPAFFSTNFATHQVKFTFQPDFPGLTAEMEAVILEHFGEHPIVQNMPLTLSGAHKISDFINPGELHRLEGLYQKYLRLLGMEEQMTFFLPDTLSGGLSDDQKNHTELLGFSLPRSRCNFTERDRLVLNLLRPHLAQAYANTQQHQRLEQDLNQLQQSLNCLGLIILDSDLQVQSIPPQSIIWLATYFTSSTSPRQLPDHLRAWIKHQITNLTTPVDRPKAAPPLRIQLAGQELVIRLTIEQIGSRYLLLLEEQSLSPSHSLAVLGLSQRETELLDWVIQGKDTAAIAEAMGIAKGTVRKHLENLYRKLGVTSRTAAIAQALEKLGLLNASPLH